MFDSVIVEMRKLLPSFDYVDNILVEQQLERTINKHFYQIVSDSSTVAVPSDVRGTLVKVDGCRDRLWETINTGHFSKVSKIDRQLYTLSTLQKTLLQLIAARNGLTPFETIAEQCIWDLDNGLLLGCPFDDAKYAEILSDCLNVLHRHILPESAGAGTTIDFDDQYTRPRTDTEQLQLPILNSPSVQEFRENYFDKSQPVILTGCMDHWPALTKWIQPQYLLRVASHRIVPIEVGSNYTKDSWSQDMVKFQDFFRRQLLSDNSQSSARIEYLAQHNLFDQIPALKNDIVVPDYCCVSNHNDDVDDIELDIKAWLGPEGTISPMHHDPKHNLLCQVFGHKRIILASPDDSGNLYPFEGTLLGNTSQIDPENLDVDAFPLIKNVKFYECTLHAGEMLYIPKSSNGGWWHYVRSLSKSFSVSFWWK